MLDLYRRKYSTDDVIHVLIGLAYFDTAEEEPMPMDDMGGYVGGDEGNDCEVDKGDRWSVTSRRSPMVRTTPAD